MATYSKAPAESRPVQPHKLTLDERNSLQLSGVTEVVSFDENTVVLKTVKGVLLVRGQELHLQTLSVEGGQVAVEGIVNSLTYEDLKKEGGFLSRLFG